MNEPTKETRFEYILSDKNSLKDKINKLKKRVFDDNIKEFKEIYGTNSICPYINCDTYYDPNFKKYTRIVKNFSLMDDTFLIEEHTSYTFAYSISIVDLDKDNTLILYDH
ncbi:hypothetical protein QKC54_gp1011 [Megavirus baoshan]|uniref:Uncharacterized protein n=1 Tax=Megavirus baoshan TaxID=2496520 RepID=A0A8K1T0T1_9VIRU|nr:hypothetical protein QKC54_gp1011 [Megavirus baoshan]UFX99723.1 hypothetical protein Mb0061 [Megavirus baoshan]